MDLAPVDVDAPDSCSSYNTEFYTNNKEVIINCPWNPTDVSKDETYWLYARDFKHDEVYDPKKSGKWMIFLPKETINPTWKKIKEAVREGHILCSKVSTTDPDKPSAPYAIMIYTVDCTDVNDVIKVLDYLETSGIKPANAVLKYKTDEQTRAGIYAGGKQKPWIYSSDTIRSLQDNKLKQQTLPLSWRVPNNDQKSFAASSTQTHSGECLATTSWKSAGCQNAARDISN